MSCYPTYKALLIDLTFKYIYNPANNFFGLSFQDKTDHVIQNQIMVNRGYLPSDLISVVLFYFNGEKTAVAHKGHYLYKLYFHCTNCIFIIQTLL